MKPTQLILAAVITFGLAGCYNLLIVNAGVANKNAAALAAPLDPESACLALTNQGFTITRLVGNVKSNDALSLCKQILTEQQKKKEPAK